MFRNKKNAILRTMAAVFGALMLFSCKMELVSEPTAAQITTSEQPKNAILSAPTGVSATQGGVKEITLTWKEVSNASQYYIYSSPTPFDTPEKFAETQGNVHEKTLTLSPGINSYFAITTVDSSQNESTKSAIVLGSTLAVPVITEITNDEEGSSSTVNWWMANCTESTYISSVRYHIYCYKDDKTTLVAEKITDGSLNSVTFTGLEPKTNYWYSVEAFTKDNQESTERSETVDKETAHRVIPAAPENLHILKGTQTDAVRLSWTLPDYVDTKSQGIAYEQHPLYFTIQRKPYGEDDTRFVTLVSYIGSIARENSELSDSVIGFDLSKDDPNTNTTNTKLTATPAEGGIANADYPGYIPGSTLTYQDTTAERGKRYTYRIQSFTDDVKTIVSSEASIAEDSGWLIANASFRTSAKYNKNEDETLYESIVVTFNLDFDEFGETSAYNYILTSERTEFYETAHEEKVVKSFDSLHSLNSWTQVFEGDSITQNEGYLRYKVYVAPLGTTDIPSTENYYIAQVSPNLITLTDDVNMLPAISYFNVEDGFSDKFVLTWVYDSHNEYTLQWIPVDEDENSLEPETLVLTGEEEGFTLTQDYTLENGESVTLARYEHKAVPGESRTYTLIADNGLQSTKEFKDEDEEPIVTRTLGKAKLTQEGYDYDKITLTWKTVQMAKAESESFTVTARYAGEETDEELSIPLNRTDSSEPENNPINITVEKDDEAGLYTCTITKPKGYDDALFSGRDIEISVVAESEKQSDTTTATFTAKTLGPALTAQSIAPTPQQNVIELSWNKVEGAKGYLIHRVRYTSGDAEKISEQSDTYFFDAGASNTSNKITLNGDEVKEKRAQISLSGSTYTLKDHYCEQEDTKSSYEMNQSMISWGLPFGYEVIPVLDADDFGFEGKAIEKNSKVVYENLSDVKGATIGYGLNVRARKAESASVQQVSWGKPYWSSKTPTLYKREAGSAENTWEKVTDAKPGDSSCNLTIDAREITAAFEYAVAYGTSSGKISLPASLVNGTVADKGLSSIDENYDFGEREKEKRNKGYLLAVNYSASYGGNLDESGSYKNDEYYYSEKVGWDEWDYKKRSLGPSGAYISIKNYNLSSDWTKVASLDSDLHFKAEESVTNTRIAKSGDVSLYLTPVSMATADSVNGGTMMNTKGPLMVLRDAKHYYSLTLERGSATVSLGKDDSVYAYRQINDVELVRSVALIMSGIIKQTGINGSYGTGKSFGSEDQVTGTTGTFQWGSDSGSNLKWQLNNFTYYFTSTPGNKGMDSFIKIEDSNSSKANRGAKQSGTLKHISACSENSKLKVWDYPDFTITGLIPITVSAIDIPLESYSGTVGIAAKNDKFSATVKHDGTQTFATGTVEGTDRVKRWCPMDLDGNGYNGENSTYGWWN